METKLIFVIGPPRSGSTLLQRMLSSHSAIFSCPELHIITPLAHLGYYKTVDKAPYGTIFEPLLNAGASSAKLKKPPLDRFQLERRILLVLRRNIHNNAFGKVVKKNSLLL